MNLEEEIANEIAIRVGDEANVDWKLGFLTAFYYQKEMVVQGHTIEQIKTIDPWSLEKTALEVYRFLSEEHHLIQGIDEDEFVTAFAESWEKVKSPDPLLSAFGEANNQFSDIDRSTIKARSIADDLILKRICELIAKEADDFFLPTRKLGNLFGKSRNYAALKIKKLIDEGFLVQHQKGHEYRSPRFRINWEHQPQQSHEDEMQF